MTPRFDFASDNTAGMAPEALAALVDANAGAVEAYGEDATSAHAARLVRELLDVDASVHFVPTGTAANALAPDLNSPFNGYTAVLVAATAQAGFVNCLIEGDVVGAAYAGRRRGA